MHPRVLGYMLVLAVTLLACQGAAELPAPTAGPVYTPTPTRTPEPQLPAGTCVFTTHPDAQARGGKKPEPTDAVIKGTVNEAGEKIYFVPGMRRYRVVTVNEGKGERWFCREPEAEQAGWRASASPRE